MEFNTEVDGLQMLPSEQPDDAQHVHPAYCRRTYPTLAQEH